METISVSTLAEYIEAIEKVNKTFACHHSEIWYRGISDESYALIPGLHWRGITEGKHHAMVSEFLTGYILYENNETLLSGYDLYALMQHYGLPTLLLDWTSSPLTALFFALEKEEKNESRVVWAINSIELNKITVNSPETIYTHGKSDYKKFKLDNYLPAALRDSEYGQIEKPLAVVVQPRNKRISSQHGHFTLHGSSTTPIDKYFSDANSNQCIKIEIKSATVRHKIYQQLRTIGVTEETIYQDLESLTKRINKEFDI